MDLKRCRKLSENKSLVYSSAAYVKLLDYAERLETERAAIIPAIEAHRETRSRQRCGLSIGGKIFNSGLDAAIKAVKELQSGKADDVKVCEHCFCCYNKKLTSCPHC